MNDGIYLLKLHYVGGKIFTKQNLHWGQGGCSNYPNWINTAFDGRMLMKFSGEDDI